MHTNNMSIQCMYIHAGIYMYMDDEMYRAKNCVLITYIMYDRYIHHDDVVKHSNIMRIMSFINTFLAY